MGLFDNIKNAAVSAANSVSEYFYNVGSNVAQASINANKNYVVPNNPISQGAYNVGQGIAQATTPTPSISPSVMTSFFGGGGGGGAASFLSGAAPATSTILGGTAPATSTILGGTAPIQAVQSQAGNQAAVQQYLASQGLNVSASTASTIGALSRFDTGTTQNYIPQNSNYNAPTGNNNSLSFLDKFTSGISDVANFPLYENVIPGTNIPYGTSPMNLPGSIPVQKLPTSSSQINDLKTSINKQIDTLNKNYNSSIQGGNFTGSEAQYQNFLKDSENISSSQAKLVDLQARSSTPQVIAADLGKSALNFFTPTTLKEQIGKIALITGSVLVPLAAPELLASPIVNTFSNVANPAFISLGISGALNKNLTPAERIISGASAGVGLLGVGSIAKDTILNPLPTEEPQITFVAQVKHLRSGNQQVGVISGSTLGEDNILSPSYEIVSPSGISLGGGYSMQTINKETTFSKYLTGGSSEELGQANLIHPIEKLRLSVPTGGQATLSNSVIKEIAKVNLKGEALTPDEISSQKILAIFNENPDGSFSVVGTTKPLLKINKATGEVSYVARNLNIRGEVIQFKDLQGNSIAVKIGDLSKPVQGSILNQVSASAIAKKYPPVNIPPPSASAALYRVPSYLGGGFSTNPQVSTATLSPSFISPTLTGEMTIENQNQQIAPSQVNTFVNLNNPNQNQPTITRAGTLTNLNTNQAQLQPSNLLNPSAQETSTSQDQASATKTTQTLAPKTMTRESQIQPEVSATAQQESFISKDSLLNPEVTKEVSNNLNPTTLLNLKSLIKKQKRREKKAISKYKAYTKRFGKEVYLGESQSVQGAEKLGIENTLSTLSRSVIVKNEQNQQVPLFNPNTSLFRPSKSKKNPFTLIEINPLGAKSEVREIKSYQKPSNRLGIIAPKKNAIKIGSNFKASKARRFQKARL